MDIVEKEKIRFLLKSYLETETVNLFENTFKQLDIDNRLQMPPELLPKFTTLKKEVLDYTKSTFNQQFDDMFNSLTDTELVYWKETLNLTLTPTGISAVQKIKPQISSIIKNSIDFLTKNMLDML